MTKPVPADWTGKRIYLNFTGLQGDAIVWVNDNEIGEVSGPNTRIDITSAAVPGTDAKIRLWVTNYWIGTESSRQSDPFRDNTIKDVAKSRYQNDESAYMKTVPAGVTGSISLQAVPYPAEISNILVQPSYRESALKLNVDYIPHEAIPGARFKVNVTETDGSSEDLPAVEIPVADTGAASGEIQQQLVIPWSDPHLWEVGAAYLYKVQVQLIDAGGQAIDIVDPVRFGFREIWTEGKELMLNGHPLKLRPAYFTLGVSQMKFYEGMGFNAIVIQPNDTWWFGEKGLFPQDIMQAGSKELLDAADENGWAVLSPAPSINHIYDKVDVEDPVAQQKYLDYFKMWSRELDRQNRPSILMWSPSMNKDTGPVRGPDDLGQEPTKYTPPPWLNKVVDLIKSVDPTRLVYNHDGGQTADMGATNLYLNFMPLQERENYLAEWSENGTKPWGAIEMGTLFTANFFKPANVPLYTEYSAIYFGDQAYEDEKDSYIDYSLDTIEQPIVNAFTGSDYFAQKGYAARVGNYTSYYKMMDLFTRNTNESWRTWGVNGGLFPWIFDVGFGIPPGHVDSRGINYTYNELANADQATLKNRPEWANPIYDAFRDTMQPLLVYIGGPENNFTAKDHNYTAGETVHKTIDVVWDGPGSKQLTVAWQAKSGDQVFADGEETFNLSAGSVEKREIAFTVPSVGVKTSGEVSISVHDDDMNADTTTDNFAMTLFPVQGSAGTLQSRWGIYDPTGITTAELAKIGVSATPVALGDDLANIDVLVIGYKALSANKELPFKPEDISAGKRVLFFEQDLDSLENMGFRAQDVVSRYAFARVKDSPILEGIDDADLTNWRGAGELLPTTSEGMRVWPWKHAVHVGNDGSVASVVIETPQKGAFTPLIEAEFDLAYSPLLEWKDGAGKVLYSQLDLSGRIGVEPVATKLAVNLIRDLDQPAAQTEQTKRIVYLGGNAQDIALLSDSGFRYAAIAGDELGTLAGDEDILAIGSNSIGSLTPSQISAIRDYVQAGGTAFVLPQSQADLTNAGLAWDITLKTATLTKVAPSSIQATPLLQGVGPQLLHWRSFLDLNPVDGITGQPSAQKLLDGLLLQVPDGNGLWLFDQLDASALDDGSANLKRTRWNAKRLIGQLLTNLGAQTGPGVAEQMYAGEVAEPVNISDWMVASKAYDISASTTTVNGKTALPALGAELEAETWLNDPQQPLPDGLAWETKTMDANGFLSFSSIAAPQTGKAGVAVAYLYSSRAREATFSLSSDWWFVLKVNDTAYEDQSVTGRTPNAANPGEVNVKVPLQQGWNKVEMKVGSGSGAFGFWFTVTDPGDLRVSASVTAPTTAPVDLPPAESLRSEPVDATLLYADSLKKEDDVYGFTAW
ncbi:hypothetical protein [Cohnella fermenti]|uniref:Glycoside hydrolase family 2 immunoglobulin-like beta-sandwich domain-containing protein n=1 Tax=Cohnella fermenti TaxID=2565925 RepID=A0A4S4BP74_9BACL|nr:hypothetical protein [Cohnella fermenti]THF76698.1 hypothetical protein E6C55_18175 [Cohnella fermenti]